ncbi:MAG: metal-sulfur cluster assembly factor [Pedobacter sp.]|uniref:metal-sulfur cluster assembly factor n=1 Tax=Pedobacter sp. TaxID=1411316 RepID=UPI0033913F46
MIIYEVPDNHSFMKMEVADALKTVIDPELQINIVDMGLVYAIEMSDDETNITVEMTLSSKFCPMGESIMSAVKNCILRFFPGFGLNVKLVWSPVWNHDFISDDGKRRLGTQ